MLEKNKQTEKRYIRKRKRKAFFHGLLYYLFRVFPVKKNKIAFCTFEGGGGFGCSPKYIAEELIRRDADRRYELVWIVGDMDKPFPEQIRKVKNTLLSRTYHLSTAGVWVDNTRKPFGTKKRKSQLYIQTWHGMIFIKPIGLYRGERFPEIARIVSEYDSKLIDYVLSGSDWCERTYRKGLLYDGEIIRTGTPRCDVFFNRRKKTYAEIRALYNIPERAKILLYAPTFRGGSQSGARSVNAGEPAVDFPGLLGALERRFGGQWYIMLRLHPQLAAKRLAMKTAQGADKIIEASQHPDMNELIAASDAFMSDYSSAMIEAAMIDLPIFICADDLEEYAKDRGAMMLEMHTLPYPVAQNNEELLSNIENFNAEEYVKKNRAFIAGFGIQEDGKASCRVANLIEKHIAHTPSISSHPAGRIA